MPRPRTWAPPSPPSRPGPCPWITAASTADEACPRAAGVRFLLPNPEQGSACKRLNLYLRWMVRRDSVDLGLWSTVKPAALVIPLDVHIFNVARRVRLTSYRSPGWAMARDLTARLRRFDPDDPVKYDFAFHRMGLFKKEDDIRSLRRAP